MSPLGWEGRWDTPGELLLGSGMGQGFIQSLVRSGLVSLFGCEWVWDSPGRLLTGSRVDRVRDGTGICTELGKGWVGRCPHCAGRDVVIVQDNC